MSLCDDTQELSVKQIQARSTKHYYLCHHDCGSNCVPLACCPGFFELSLSRSMGRLAICFSVRHLPAAVSALTYILGDGPLKQWNNMSPTQILI